MGIVNITDNSYFADSRCLDDDGKADLEAVRTRISRMLMDGADIIDIGACSTRPGASAVGAKVEIARLAPVLKMIGESFRGISVSIDTYWADVARFAAQTLPRLAMNGKLAINDIYAGRRDRDMLPAIAELGLPFIAMHSLDETADVCDYNGDVTGAVYKYFEDFAAAAEKAGVKDWILDPGFGFGKSIDQNWQLLNEMDRFNDFGKEILVGVSRKSMIYRKFGITPEEALPATQAAHMIALERGATILRVHDVAEAKRTVEIYKTTIL